MKLTFTFPKHSIGWPLTDFNFLSGDVNSWDCWIDSNILLGMLGIAEPVSRSALLPFLFCSNSSQIHIILPALISEYFMRAHGTTCGCHSDSEDVDDTESVGFSSVPLLFDSGDSSLTSFTFSLFLSYFLYFRSLFHSFFPLFFSYFPLFFS